MSDPTNPADSSRSGTNDGWQTMQPSVPAAQPTPYQPGPYQAPPGAYSNPHSNYGYPPSQVGNTSPASAYYPPPGPAVDPQNGYAQLYGRPHRSGNARLIITIIAIFFSIPVLAVVGFVAVRYFYLRPPTPDTPDHAVKLLHLRMKQRDDMDIYNAADPAYQLHVTREQSDAQFDRVALQLGDPQKYQLIQVRKVDAPGDVVNAYVQTTFQHGTANERVQLRKLGGDYLIVAYYIQSDTLGTQLSF